MKNRLAKELGGAFTKIARAMSRNFGIDVVPSGFACNTDGDTTIRIPFNADDMAEADQKVIHGLLDHEVQHVVEEREAREAQAEGKGGRTPMQIMKACKSRREQMLLNVFEDIRIENKASKKYIGVAENLAAANLNSVEMFKRRHEADGMEHANFWHALGSAIILKARGFSVAWLPTGMVPYLAMVDAEVEASKDTKSAEDCHKLALKVLAKVGDKAEEIKKEQEKREKAKKEAAEKAKKEAAEKAEKSKEKGEEGDEEDAGAEDGEKSDESGAGDESDEDGQEDSTDGSSDQEDGDSGEDTEEGSAGGDEDSDEGDEEAEGADGEGDKGEGDEQPKGGKGEAGEGDEQPKGGKGEAGDVSEMSDEELAEAGDMGANAEKTDATTSDMVNEVKDQVKGMAVSDARDHRRYVPSPDAQSRDTWIKPDGDMADYEKAREVVNSQIHAMKAKLLTLIRSRAAVLYEGDQERGDIDNAALYGLRMGNKRIFSTRTPEETLDTAVSIVIDLSGSMGSGSRPGNGAYQAKLMAIALGETLNALNIPFEIIGFHNPHNGYCAPSSPEGFVWGRWLPFEFHVFKAFNDTYRQTKQRLSGITGMQENVDGEAVLAIARRLAARQESRKIMFVLSDGVPLGGCDEDKARAHLQEVVTMITDAGIEVFGIGACSPQVKDYYGAKQGASYIVVNDLSKLAVEVYKLMRSKVSSGAKAVA